MQKQQQEWRSTKMTENVTFFDPHPGVGGAMLPLDENVKAACDALDGKTMRLYEGKDLIGDQILRISADVVRMAIVNKPPTDTGGHGFIKMTIGEIETNTGTKVPQHGWRLIRFRRVNP